MKWRFDNCQYWRVSVYGSVSCLTPYNPVHILWDDTLVKQAVCWELFIAHVTRQNHVVHLQSTYILCHKIILVWGFYYMFPLILCMIRAFWDNISHLGGINWYVNSCNGWLWHKNCINVKVKIKNEPVIPGQLSRNIIIVWFQLGCYITVMHGSIQSCDKSIFSLT